MLSTRIPLSLIDTSYLDGDRAREPLATTAVYSSSGFVTLEMRNEPEKAVVPAVTGDSRTEHDLDRCVPGITVSVNERSGRRSGVCRLPHRFV